MARTETTLQKCIDDCLECHRICLETAHHCLTMGGKHAEASHIGSLQNCASICETSAQFMISDSPLHPRSCKLCAEVCLQCAESCEKIGADDEMMKRCAEVCRRCADSCREMASGSKQAA